MSSQQSPIHQQNDYQHLSTSLPLGPQSSSTDLLTSSFHPSSLDDFCFLNGDPLNDHGIDLFSLAPQNEGLHPIHFDPSGIQNLDEFGLTAFSMASTQPILSSSLDAFPFQFHMPTKPIQQQSNTDHLQVPSYKAHRRKRSSSVPPFFHSVKKQIIQSTPPSNGHLAPPNSAQSIPMVAHHQYGKPLPIPIERNPALVHRHPSPVSLDQQQLDDKLLQVDFNDITVAGLKDCLRERNLSVAGRKAELVDRLRNERQRVYAQRQKKISAVDYPQVTPALSHRTPPSSPSSISSSPSPQRSINQLAHRLDGLGFHPTSTSSTLTNDHQMTTPSQPPFYFHPSIPQEFKLPVDSIQQQWFSDSSMNFYPS